MGKKDKKKAAGHKERVAQKTASKQSKKEVKNSKKKGRDHDDDDEDMDIDSVLEQYRREQDALLKVTEEACVDPPSMRSNATLTASVLKNELFLFGGEKFENETSAFYNDLYVFSPNRGQWTRYTSPSAPLPRSGHQMAVHPLNGHMYLFGGEFSSPKGNTFYHYSDLHQLNPQSRQFTKIQTSGSTPSARSGHRMIFWRHFLILFGGFHDTSSVTKYHNDLWVFDSVEEKWTEIKNPGTARGPEPRSGFTLLPSQDGAVLIGGYAKVKGLAGKMRGVIFNDIWVLKMAVDLKQVRWERRRKAPFAPSPRCGVSMAPHKGRGILFGGVFDQEESEEDLSSIFYNDLLSPSRIPADRRYAYQIGSNRYFELKLRPPRTSKRKPAQPTRTARTDRAEDELKANLNALTLVPETDDPPETNGEEEESTFKWDDIPLSLNLPTPRFNAALAVAMDDKLYVYGGTYEVPGRGEVTLDDFHVIDLGRLDGVRTLWNKTKIVEPVDEDEDDDEIDEESESESDEQASGEQMEDIVEASKPAESMDLDLSASQPLDREAGGDATSADSADVASTSFNPAYPAPLPFESLKAYYDRTAKEWILVVVDGSKAGRREAFARAEGYWWECREEIREIEERMEESGVREVVAVQAERKDKRR